jgi:small subunit ribosomal protein S6
MAKPLPAERAYESLFICPSDTPQKNIDGFIEKIKTTLVPSKGVLRGVQIWGRRRLTYPIKHHRDALYIYIDYTAEKSAPEAMKTLFHVTDFVLRATTTDKVVLRPPYVRKLAGVGESAEGAAATGATTAAGTATATPAPSAPSAVSPETASTETPSEKEA